MTAPAMMEIVVEAENEKTISASLEAIANIEKLRYRSGKTSLKIIQDETVPLIQFFMMATFHPFFQIFHDTVHRLMETGATKIPKTINNQLYDDEVPALVLTMDDLGIGFLVCSVPLILGALAFVVEVAITKAKRLTEHIRDISTAVFVLTAFLHSKTVVMS